MEQREELAIASDVLARVRMVVLALTRSPDGSDMTDLLISQAVAAVGASGGVLGATRDDARMEVLASRGLSEQALAGLDQLRIGPDLPLTDAVHRGEAVWLSGPLETVNRYPRLAAGPMAPAPASVSLPLLIGEQPIGALGVTFDEPRVLNPTERLFLLSLADICALFLWTWERRGDGDDQRRSRLLIDALRSFVGLCAADGTLLEANRSAAEAARNAGQDIVGKPLWDTYWWSWDPAAQQRLRAAFARGRRGHTSRYDVEVCTGTSGLITIDFQLVPVLEAGRVTALVASGVDVTQRRRAAHRSAALARLGHALGAALTVREVQGVIVDLVPAVLDADATAVGVLDRVRQRVRLARSAGVLVDLAGESGFAELDDPLDICAAASDGVPIIRGTHPGADFTLTRAQRVAGLTATATVPLVKSPGGSIPGNDSSTTTAPGSAAGGTAADGTAADGSAADGGVSRPGEPVGALAVAFSHPVRLTSELRTLLGTAAQMCAQSLERARLYEARLLDTRRVEALSRLAQQMATATTTAQVCSVLADRVPEVVGGAAATIALVSPDGGQLILLHDTHLDRDLADRYDRQALRDPLPLPDAARTGRPIYLPDLETYRRRYPSVAADFASAGLRSAALLPLRSSDEATIGAVGIAWDHPVVFDTGMRAALATVAQLCGQTLERAHLYDAEHLLVEGLQRRLLRPIPAVPSIEVDAVYLPADPAVGMGGDFYSGLQIDPHHLALVVGDIAGHGVAGAAGMAELRTMLTTLLSIGTPLDEIFDRVDSALLLSGSTVTFATAVVALCDTRAGTLEYLHAGHPPLLLRRPDGTVQVLEDGRRPLIGVPAEPARAARVPFPPGSVLVAYTDGLVEGRRQSVDVGIARLAAALAGAEGSAAGIADTLLRQCRDRSVAFDDVALVVLRRLAGS